MAHKIYKKLFAFLIIAVLLLSGAVFVMGGYGASGPSAAPNLAEHGLVGYWNMEEGTGQAISDRSGSANNGTLGADSSVGKDDPVFTAGYSSAGPGGTALQFDGMDDYVNAGSGTSLNFASGQGFSFSAWVKTNDSYGQVISFRDSVNANPVIDLAIGYNGTTTQAGHFIPLMRYDNNSGLASFTSTVNIADNVWHFVVFVYNPSTQKIYAYVDNSSWNVAQTVAGSITTATDRAVGAERYWVQTAYGTADQRYLNGSIDEVRIYNRALSADEIRQLYNQKKPILEMKFDEGSGQVAYDGSFNSNDGIIYGAAGTAEAGAANTLTDNNKTWTTNEWTGETIEITGGTGSGQTRTVSSNTATIITVSSNWTTNPDATSVYRITSRDEWTTGKFGSALSFDGTDDYVEIPTASSLNFVNSSNYTIATWFNPQYSYEGAEDIIIQHVSGTGQGRSHIWLDLAESYCPGAPTNEILSYLGGTATCSGVSASKNIWYYVVETVVENGTSDQVKLYVDGVLKVTNYVNSESNIDGAWRIGKHRIYEGNNFEGIIDEVRFYNYARTQDEILADYNAGKAAHLGKDSQRDDGLVGYWNMEEGTGQTVSDRSGNGNNGTLGANTSVGKDDPVFASGYSSSGPGGTGLQFDGKDDYVNVADSPYDFTGNFSISAWVYPKNLNSAMQTFICKAESSGYCLEIGGYSANTANFSVHDGTAYRAAIGDSALSNNNWYHIVGVVSGTSVKLYINNILQTTQGTLIAAVSTNNYNLSLGVNPGSSYTNFFNGSIDEVRIYNRALSADEIRQLYNQKKPVLEMKFDEGSGQIAYDGSFNNNDGTLGSTSGSDANDPTWTTGKYGSALSFDGVDDYVTASANGLDITSTLTISAWVKRTSTSAVQKYVAKGRGSIGGYSVGVGTGGYHRFTKYGVADYTSTQVSPLNAFEHVVWTVQSDNLPRLYINGELKYTVPSSAAIKTDTYNALIGAEYTSAGTITSYFGGFLDDVRVYNYARTQDEILADYNLGKAAHLGKDSQRDDGLVGYWNMEEGTGQTISDRSGNGNNGTLGANSSVGKDDPVFASGYSSSGPGGTALKFDGVDDYVLLGSDNNYAIANKPITITGWMYPTAIGTIGSKIFWRRSSTGTVNGFDFGLRPSNVIAFDFSGATSLSRRSNINMYSLNTWSYVAMTWDGSTTAANSHIYINGVEVTYATTIDGVTLQDTTGYQPMIGNRNDLLRGYYGSIDEVRIYNRALSADEIRQLYNQKKPILEMKFDEGSGQVAYDGSFNNNDGWLGGTSSAEASDPIWVAGKEGSALSFDGGDRIDIADNATLQSDQLTIGAWVRNTGSSWKTIAAKGQATSAWWFGSSDTNKLLLKFNGTSGSPYSANTNLNDSLWHYVTGTYDGSFIRVYVDGKLDNIPFASSGITNKTGILQISGNNYWGCCLWVGSIDSVRIYNYARTPLEILADYNNGLAAHLR